MLVHRSHLWNSSYRDNVFSLFVPDPSCRLGEFKIKVQSSLKSANGLQWWQVEGLLPAAAAPG